MKRILVATDFSDTAVRAGEIAVDLARRSGDTLVLLHVSAPPSTLVQELAADARAFEEGMRQHARSELRAGAEEIRAQGLAVEERLEDGEAPAVIAKVAKEVDARLVVLGNRGRGAIARALLGSVAHETLMLADRPILLARKGPAPRGFDEWAAGARPLRVVLAVDRSPGTAAAVAWLRGLRELGPVDIRLLHVFDPTLEALRLGLGTGESGRHQTESTMEREIREFVGELPGAGSLSFSLRPSAGRPGAIVADEADATGADLLVLGTHQRTRAQRIWLGSTAELALRAARVPVLVAPAVSRAALEETGRPDELC